MSFRGRGRGRGGFGGDGGFRYVKDVPFEPFPEIEGLSTAQYSTTHIQLVRWSTNLHKDCHISPFYYEDKRERPKRQKVDIERFSDRNSQATKVKPPLWDVIHLDTDHMPPEISRGGEMKHKKKLKWTGDSDWNKLEHFEELDQKRKGQEGAEKNEDEEQEEDAVGEDDGEFSDEGDYAQGEYCDDDEDDFNMADDNDGTFSLIEYCDDDEDDFNMADDNDDEPCY